MPGPPMLAADTPTMRRPVRARDSAAWRLEPASRRGSTCALAVAATHRPKPLHSASNDATGQVGRGA